MSDSTVTLVKDVATLVVAFSAVAIGLWQYHRTSKRDFVKPLRESQLRLYQEATSAAAKLATHPRDFREWKEAHAEFLCLYFGPLAMLEDFDHGQGAVLTVEQAMIVFKTCLDKGSEDARLKNLSLALAHTCRESLGRSWRMQLPEAADLPELHGEYQKTAVDDWNQIRNSKLDARTDSTQSKIA